MGWLRWSVALLCATGCGRIAFDPASSGDGGDDDDDGGPPPACPAFAIACEGFESGNYSQWPLVEVSNPNSVAVTSTRPHTGSFSLETNKLASGSPAIADIARPFGARSTGMIAVREWVNTVAAFDHYNLVVGLGDMAADNYIVVGGDTAGQWAISEYRMNASMTIDQGSTKPTVNNQWLCLEVRFTFGNPPRAQILVDNAMVLDVNAILPSPTFDYLRVGGVRNNPTGFHVFVDDIVLATQPIGCN